MTTPRIEEKRKRILDEMNSRRIDGKTYIDSEWLLAEYEKELTAQAHQAGIDEERERISDQIERKRHQDVGTYSKESSLLSTGYNHCIDDVHKIINGNNQEDE